MMNVRGALARIALVVGLTVLSACQAGSELPDPFAAWKPINQPQSCNGLGCVIVRKVDERRFAVCARSVDKAAFELSALDRLIGILTVCRHGSNDLKPMSDFPDLMKGLPRQLGDYCTVATCALKPKGSGG